MRKKSEKTTRIVWGIVIFILIASLAIATSFFLSSYEQSQKEGIHDSLQAVFQTVHKAVNTWRTQQIANATLWADQPNMVILTQELLALERSKEVLIQSPAQGRIRDLLKPVYQSDQYRGFFIIAPDGTSLASTRDTNIGTRNLILDVPGVFDTALQGVALVTRPQPSDVPLLDSEGMRFRERMPTMFVATPIRNPQGSIIAVLTLRIRPEVTLYPIIEQGRIGDSGESYLFDEQGTLLSESRYVAELRRSGLLQRDQISAFNIVLREANREGAPLIHAVQEARNGIAGYDLDGYRDYRGTQVVGVWSWIDSFGFGLVTEVDVEEAYSNLYRIRTTAWIAVSVIALMLIALGVFFASAASRLTRMVVERTRELHQQREQYQAIIDGAFDAIVIIEDAGQIVRFNRAAAQLFGYEPDEVMGRNVKLLTPDEIAHAHDGYIQRYRDTGEARLIGKVREVKARHQDGSLFWVELSLIEVGLGDQHRFVGFLRDIHDRKRAEQESETYNRTLFEQSPAGLMLLAPDLRLADVNPAFAQIVNRPIEQLLTASLTDLLAPEQREELLNTLDAMEDSDDAGYGPLDVAFSRGKRDDDTPVQVRLTGRVLLRNGERYIWSVAEDVSEQRAYEEALTEARDQAERASLAKSQFLANMSHELRTPLNAVIGYAEMLEEDAQDDGNDEIVPDLQRIVGSAKHLLELINDILDISKIEAGRQELFIEPFDLQRLLENIRETVEALTAKRNNRLEIQCDDQIVEMVGDQQRVRQVLFNLIGNAAKFTENGRIGLDVTLTHGDAGERVAFKLSDTGIGMNAEQLNKIFDPFTQADGSTTRRYGGTGLGLTIVSQFVELMEGDLAVQSEPGKGSCFTVTLPLIHSSHLSSGRDSEMTTEEAVSSLITNDAQQDQQRPLVLLVEDTADSMELMKRTLERHGFRTACAVAGDEGLALAQALKPAVIVLDIMLPGMSGWGVLQRLKENTETQDIPVVLCSSLDETRRGYVLGASAYLRKPIGRENFIETVQRLTPGISLASLKVLVVEDDADAQRLLSRFLQQHTRKVDCADNGRIGLERVAKERPDLVLLDLMMPEMDGFEFLERLQANPATASIPVIVITAKVLTGEEQDQLRTGAYQILHKANYSHDKLLRSIFEAIKDAAEGPSGDQA